VKVLILIISFAALSACTSPVKTVCRDWPAVISDNADREDVLVYINHGHAAWRSCKLAAEGK